MHVYDAWDLGSSPSLMLNVLRTCLTVFAGPARLTVTDVVTDEVLTGVRVHTRTAATLILIQLALWPLPPRGTQTLVTVDRVQTRTRVLTGVRRTLVYVCK